MINTNITELKDALSELVVSWLIEMIGDSDLCPNLYLKMNLMNMLRMVVDLSESYGIPALEAVLSACSHECSNLTKDHKYASFCIIKEDMKIFSKYKYCSLYDEQLAARLKKVKSSRINAIVHDVAYCNAVNTCRETSPRKYCLSSSRSLC